MIEKPYCDYCKQDNYQRLYSHDDWRRPDLLGFVLVQCRDCHLVYLNPRPTPYAIKAFYPPEYPSFHMAIEDEQLLPIRWMRRRSMVRRRKMVEKYFGRQTGRVLDVGCGTGIFLQEMKQNGWQTQGVEFTDYATNYAIERFGLDVFQGMLNEASFEPESFDVITFWDVLEHTFSPSDTLSITYSLLRHRGIVAIHIPNWESPLRHWFGPHWIGFDPPRHLYVFPHDVLEKMLVKAGFEVLDWVSCLSTFWPTVTSLIRMLTSRKSKLTNLVHRLLHFPGVRLIFEPYSLYLNKTKRGGNIAVFARKKQTGTV